MKWLLRMELNNCSENVEASRSWPPQFQKDSIPYSPRPQLPDACDRSAALDQELDSGRSSLPATTSRSPRPRLKRGRHLLWLPSRSEPDRASGLQLIFPAQRKALRGFLGGARRGFHSSAKAETARWAVQQFLHEDVGEICNSVPMRAVTVVRRPVRHHLGHQCSYPASYFVLSTRKDIWNRNVAHHYL